jgi:vancomycin permeability regulator SanA
MKKNTMIIIGVVVALLVFGLLYSMMIRKKKSTKKEKFDDVQALEFQKVDMAMGGSGVLSDPIDQSRSEDLSPWRGELGM